MLQRLISRPGAVALMAMALCLAYVTVAQGSNPDYDIPDIPEMAGAGLDSGSGWWPEDARLRLYGVLSVFDLGVAEAGPFNIGNFAHRLDKGSDARLELGQVCG